ncbi:hypothetical protein GGI59_006330 [Rhizobium lentis]|uniref:Uncharacterized protein n=1 Tax=Rhizobium lentis TaxID=1138194 RepID=A0A7W8XKP9_9HYPH|nr:hypothetical protein [Rhizobium lentis]MBB5564621.1 hypothetical protein [Rhizobium lentis]
MSAGQRSQLLSNGGRSREGNFPDNRVRNKIIRNIGWNSKNEIEHARRQACVCKGANQLGAACRRLLRPLHNNRAAGGKGRRNLPHRLIQRKIPGTEGRHRTDRLLDNHLPDIGRSRWNQTPVGPASLFGKPVNRIGSPRRFRSGFSERFALLQRHDPRDRLRAVAQDLGGSTHKLCSLERTYAPPLFKAGGSGRKRFVEIALAGIRNAADDLARSRIDYTEMVV